MKATNWKDVAELIGIAAIVASLIFVGLQMKQSHEIALAEIYQARTATVVDWDNDMASNILAMTAFMKSEDGRFEEIQPFELWAGWYKTTGNLMLLENSHYQYTLGFLSEEHWVRVRRNLKQSMQDPLFKQVMDATMFNRRDSFRAIIEEIQRELESESSGL